MLPVVLRFGSTFRQKGRSASGGLCTIPTHPEVPYGDRGWILGVYGRHGPREMGVGFGDWLLTASEQPNLRLLLLAVCGAPQVPYGTPRPWGIDLGGSEPTGMPGRGSVLWTLAVEQPMNSQVWDSCFWRSVDLHKYPTGPPGHGESICGDQSRQGCPEGGRFFGLAVSSQ